MATSLLASFLGWRILQDRDHSTALCVHDHFDFVGGIHERSCSLYLARLCSAMLKRVVDDREHTTILHVAYVMATHRAKATSKAASKAINSFFINTPSDSASRQPRTRLQGDIVAPTLSVKGLLYRQPEDLESGSGLQRGALLWSCTSNEAILATEVNVREAFAGISMSQQLVKPGRN